MAQDRRPGIDANEKKYDVAIFDFDGTLIDTASIFPFIHKEVLRELGVAENDISYLTLNYWIDNINTNTEHIDVPAYLIDRHGLQDVTNGHQFRVLRQNIELEYFSGLRTVPELHELSAYGNVPVLKELQRHWESNAKCFIVSHNYGRIVFAANEKY